MGSEHLRPLHRDATYPHVMGPHDMEACGLQLLHEATRGSV
jgi:hypothetical protein